jgi:hypothetical protein
MNGQGDPMAQAKARLDAEREDAREGEEREREASRAAEEKERRRLAQIELAERQKAILHAIKPHEQRRNQPMRQVSFWVTEEEHENLSENARNLGLTKRALIAKCLQPVTQKMKVK